MEESLDGEYQTYKSRDGAYVREQFFGKDPVLLERVADMSDDEIWLLNRGGLDQQKVYAAYYEAARHRGQPTVILAKTIKGYGMGTSGEGQMVTHQAKKMTEEALLAFRDRFELPLTDDQVRAAEYLMFYKEAEHGQILEEGITEAGSISSFIAAGTSYSAHAVPMIPFYIYYSMFGYQRVGDLVWAAGDQRTRGFMLGGTAGRTTLNGEGLQHQDGHSHVLFPVVPNVRAYDPAFSYELAVIIHDGLRRMVSEQEDVFYYLTLMNENY